MFSTAKLWKCLTVDFARTVLELQFRIEQMEIFGMLTKSIEYTFTKGLEVGLLISQVSICNKRCLPPYLLYPGPFFSVPQPPPLRSCSVPWVIRTTSDINLLHICHPRIFHLQFFWTNHMADFTQGGEWLLKYVTIFSTVRSIFH